MDLKQLNEDYRKTLDNRKNLSEVVEDKLTSEELLQLDSLGQVRAVKLLLNECNDLAKFILFKELSETFNQTDKDIQKRLLKELWHTGGNTPEERYERTYDKIVKKINQFESKEVAE